MSAKSVQPVEIRLEKKARLLRISFDDGVEFALSCELLRVYSPSAEVRGHSPGQERLEINKENVNIDQIVPMGTYAVALHFDDGHDSGIFTWDYLYELGANQASRWQDYLDRLQETGHQHRALDN